jgi:hypothetical protein
MDGAEVGRRVFRIVSDGGSNIKVTPLYGVHGVLFSSTSLSIHSC